jgi:predicted AlkP superfamily phosphohydrolase/phosphomutase
MMIGWDGADWDLILPLLERGELPHLAALMEGGTYGSLQSFVPSISPAIWTTVVTGVSPAEHGIKRFYNKRPRLERWWSRLKNFGSLERVLYSNADRRVRTLWNELSDRDKKVLVVGYHNTFPVEEVKGMMVSNYLVQDSIGDLMQMRSDGGSDSSFSLSLVHPADQLLPVLDLQKEVNEASPQALRQFVDMTDSEYRDFLRKSRKLDPEGDQRPYFLSRAYTFDTMLAEAALRYNPEIEPEMLFVHFQGLDWAAHQFLYFHQPELYEEMGWSSEVQQEMEAQLSAYRGTVVAFYHYMDEVLGRLLAVRSPATGVILLSDHGFEPDHDHLIPGYHDEAPPGILVINGPGIRRDHRLEGASVYDIFPTLMASFELPVAEDLAGQVQKDVFCPEAWAASHQTTVASYQGGERFVPAVAKPPGLNQELLDQLKSLGYLK